MGTPAFIPPEQAVGEIERVNERSDVFGLGALLAVILTGKPPYVGETFESVRVQAVRGKLEDCFARLDASGAEPELVALCKKCLAFEPADRPADAGAVAAAVAGLRAAADERARQAELERVRVEGEQATAQARAAERRKRRRLVLGAAALLALAAIGGLRRCWQVQRRANADLAEKNAALAAEHAKATQAQKIAQAERQQAVTNLYHARVEEAGALRRARAMGYRGTGLQPPPGSPAARYTRQGQRPASPGSRQLPGRLCRPGADHLGRTFPPSIRDIALTPDGENLAVALDNDTIELRSVRTGRVAAQMTESAIGLGIDPDKRWLITLGAKGAIKAWPDLGTATPPVHDQRDGCKSRGDVEQREVCGRLFAAERGRGACPLGRRPPRGQRRELDVPPEKFRGGFQVSDDGQRVAQCVQGELKLHALVWDLPAPAPKKVFFANTSQTTRALAISPDGRFLACFHGDDGLILLDLQESLPRPLIRSDTVLGALLQRRRPLPGLPHDHRRHQTLERVPPPGGGDPLPPRGRGTADSSLVTFSADGSTFATIGHPFHRIWKLSGSGEKPALSGHEGGVSLRRLQRGREDAGIGEQGPIGQALGRRDRAAPAHPPALRYTDPIGRLQPGRPPAGHGPVPTALATREDLGPGDPERDRPTR